MRPHHPHKQLWQVTVEAASPLSVTTGSQDGLDDTRLRVGPNCLPIIPATALAGTMRHRLDRLTGNLSASDDVAASLTELIFGWAEGSSGQPSALEITNAFLHDAHDRPVVGLILSNGSLNDRLLKPLLEQAPIKRRRVGTGELGTADPGAFFDRSVLPAGYRFSFDMLLHARSAEVLAKQGAVLVRLLQGPWFVGGQTRSGLGAIQLVSLSSATLDLREANDLKKFIQLGHLGDLGRPHLTPMPMQDLAAVVSDQLAPDVVVTIDGRAVGPLRVGGGTRALVDSDTTPHDLPYTEPCVKWSDPVDGKQSGSLDWRVVIPGSSIKGAVRHRVAFHDRCMALSRPCLPTTVADLPVSPASHHQPTAVQALFGTAATRDEGHAGVLIFPDVTYTLTSLQEGQHLKQADTHVVVDRLSGRGRSGGLFNVQNLYFVPLQLCLCVDQAALDRLVPDAWRRTEILGAFQAALDDLMNQRLALGADGLGFIQGIWKGPDAWNPDPTFDEGVSPLERAA